MFCFSLICPFRWVTRPEDPFTFGCSKSRGQGPCSQGPARTGLPGKTLRRPLRFLLHRKAHVTPHPSRASTPLSQHPSCPPAVPKPGACAPGLSAEGNQPSPALAARLTSGAPPAAGSAPAAKSIARGQAETRHAGRTCPWPPRCPACRQRAPLRRRAPLPPGTAVQGQLLLSMPPRHGESSRGWASPSSSPRAAAWCEVPCRRSQPSH